VPDAVAHANEGCHCVDIPLMGGRDDHVPQHPGGTAKPDLPPLPVAWIARQIATAPPAAVRCNTSVDPRAPPWSPQAPPLLRRSVLLLI
jgi:hypothetical protein